MGEDIDQHDDQPKRRTITLHRNVLIAAAAGAILVIIIVIAFIFGWPQHTWKHLTAKSTSKKSYGYTLTPPKGWVKLKTPPTGASVAFAAPNVDADSGNTLRAYIAVQTTALSQEGQKLSFRDIEKSYVSRLVQGVKNYQQIKAANATIDHSPVLLLEYAFSQDNANVTNETLLMEDHGMLYDVSGEALTSSFEQHAKDINTALVTFRP